MSADINILIAGDFHRTLEAYMDRAGFTPIKAASALEAAAILFAVRCSALIANTEPGMDAEGWQVARAARAHVPALPVIYVLGQAVRGWPSQGVGRSVVLQRPCTGGQLVAALCGLLNRG
jgi:hypothetical protein